MSKICQNIKTDVKWQKVKQMDKGGGSQEKIFDTINFTHNGINFDITYEGHHNRSNIFFMNILRVFDEHHM